MPEPPEIGRAFSPASMQMSNISGRNKPVPHSGDNFLGHTKDISNMYLG